MFDRSRGNLRNSYVCIITVIICVHTFFSLSEYSNNIANNIGCKDRSGTPGTGTRTGILGNAWQWSGVDMGMEASAP